MPHTGNRLAVDNQKLMRLDHGSSVRSAVSQSDNWLECHAKDYGVCLNNSENCSLSFLPQLRFICSGVRVPSNDTCLSFPL